MKNFNFKSFFYGVIVTAVVCTTTLVFAETRTAINVVLDKVKLVVNGKSVNGTTILYNGTTYVPLRTISENLGIKVNYDSGSDTAYIGENSNKTSNVSNNLKYNVFGVSIPSFKAYSSDETLQPDDDKDEVTFIYYPVSEASEKLNNYHNDLVNDGFVKYEKPNYSGNQETKFLKNHIEVETKQININGKTRVIVSIEYDYD